MKYSGKHLRDFHLLLSVGCLSAENEPHKVKEAAPEASPHPTESKIHQLEKPTIPSLVLHSGADLYNIEN